MRAALGGWLHCFVRPANNIESYHSFVFAQLSRLDPSDNVEGAKEAFARVFRAFRQGKRNVHSSTRTSKSDKSLRDCVREVKWMNWLANKRLALQVSNYGKPDPVFLYFSYMWETSNDS